MTLNSARGFKLPCSLTDHMRASYSFEYDALTDDYYVVIAWIRGYNIDCNNCIDAFELFSMRTNSWKQFDAIKDYRGTRFREIHLHFLFVNGAIHWLTDTGELVKAIVAFDFTKRNYSEIPLPDDCFVNDCILRLEVFGGCLCLLGFPREPPPGFAVLWMMKQYKVKSSWTKLNYVPQHATTPFCDFYFWPIYFTKAGQIVGNSSIGLAKLNDKGELLQHRGDHFRSFHIYTESLLSLPSDSEDDKK